MMLIGVLVLVPVVTVLGNPEEVRYLPAFLVPGLGAIGCGIGICCLVKEKTTGQYQWKASLRNASFTVLFAWVFAIVIGAIPFVLGKQATVLHALFEAVSGYTTTGLSVLMVEQLPAIFLFHRSFMQFCGGLGFVFIMVMVVSEKQSMTLYLAEGHSDQLAPNLKKTAQTVCVMYFSFLMVGTGLYAVAGMPVFEGLLHAMCALSTGGFSTKLASIGAYKSVGVELVTIALMLVGTTNFAVLLQLARRKWRQAAENSELRFLGVLLVLFIPLMALTLCRGLGTTPLAGLRIASFEVISALSTSGFCTVSYTDWPDASVFLLIVLMLIGGGLGSTAGGIKLSRVYIMLRATWLNVKRKLSPARRVEAPYYRRAQGKTPIDNSLISDVTGYISCYLLLYLAGVWLITMFESCSLKEAMFEFASSLGTVGLSIGVTSADAAAGTLLTEMGGMMLGRLEIYLVITGIYTGVEWLLERK